jgi:hypothetical protein
MLTTSRHAPAYSSSPPSEPRLVLASDHRRGSVLDGGWWPRSWDPIAELPGLLLVLAKEYGPIRNVMLSNRVWDGRFRRLTVGDRVIRVGWFASLDPALAIVITDRSAQIDLLVVPPQTPEATARRTMARAADATDPAYAQDLMRTEATATS